MKETATKPMSNSGVAKMAKEAHGLYFDQLNPYHRKY